MSYKAVSDAAIDIWIVREREEQLSGKAMHTYHSDSIALKDNSLFDLWTTHAEREESLKYGLNEEGRKSFLYRRAIRRLILRKYTKRQPRELVIESDSFSGKPMLGGQMSDVCFSSSSSGGLMAVAVGHEMRLGVDIEKETDDLSGKESLQLARNFFSTREYNQILRTGPPDSRRELFFKLWVLKEAWAKARGQGLGQPLDSFSILLQDSPKLLMDEREKDTQSESGWQLATFNPSAGYVGAIAYESRIPVNQLNINHVTREDFLNNMA